MCAEKHEIGMGSIFGSGVGSFSKRILAFKNYQTFVREFELMVKLFKR